MSKTHCPNCRTEISKYSNWQIGKFRCRECNGEEVKIDEDRLVKEVLAVLERNIKNKND